MSYTVIKRDHDGQHVLSYQGELVERGSDDETGGQWVCLRATFAIDYADLGPFAIQKGDQMTEWFYSKRYYNVFKIEDGDSGALKGWYCNITRPAEITDDSVASDDLALDIVIAPGVIALLDEDEFEALGLSAAETQRCWDAVTTIKQLVATKSGPFAN